MTKRGWIKTLPLALLAVASAGCGSAGGSNSASPPPTSSPAGDVTAFLQDAPVSSSSVSSATSLIDVAALQVSITGATLSDSSSTPVVLSSSTQQIELRHLDLAFAIAIQATNIPAADYKALNLTFANPKLTVINSQGQAIQLDGTTTPSVRLAQVQVNAPLSATVSSGGHLGLSITFDLLRSVSTDSNGDYVITPVVDASVVPSSPQDNQLVETVATIKAISSSGHTVTVQLAGKSQTISVASDSNTLFGPNVGQFSNLQTGQNITMDAKFQSDGTYLATFIGSAAPDLTMTFEGILASVGKDSSGNPIISIVAQN
jgi:hypothetical protein